jgi:HEAT repeat protein
MPHAQTAGKTEGQAVEKPRSKRLYVYWGIALFLLLALSTFCWAVVVPVFRVRSLLRQLSVALDREESAAIRGVKTRLPLPSNRELIADLGGPAEAARAISMYLRLPESLAGERLLAAELLGFCGAQALPELRRLLDDPDLFVQVSAVTGLGRIGAECQGARSALIAALVHQDEGVRRASALELCDIGVRAVPDLANGLDSPNRDLRFGIVWVLARVGGHEAVSALEAAMRDEDTSVRQAAAEALEKIKQASEGEK